MSRKPFLSVSHTPSTTVSVVCRTVKLVYLQGAALFRESVKIH